MKFSIKTQMMDTFKTDGVLVGAFQGEASRDDLKTMDKALGGHLTRAIRARHFEFKPGQTLAIDSLGRFPAGKIVIVGLGKRTELSADKVRKASAAGTSVMKNSGVKKFGTTLASESANGLTVGELAQASAEGAYLSSYTFDSYKSKKDDKRISEITHLTDKKSNVSAIDKGARKGKILAESACFARDLINMPGNMATPTFLANQAKQIASRYGIKCSVLGPKAIEKLGMGGLCGVARGSHEPARFIILEWMKGPKTKKPIVLVGKGLTFDTGGISIKPSGDMHEMKSDMSGGAAVLGAMRAAAALKLKANLVGLVPSTENMPGGSATKPGDVLTGLSGVTMEVLNTDAEGRLILADALAYAGRYKPDCVVDMATLTGACMVALGHRASGLFGNDEKLIDQIRKAGERTGERCWPMPLWEEYDEDIKSDIADVKNIGPRWGGAITAAAFLKKHVKGKWAHVDIAGTAYTNSENGYLKKGGVGLGVRLMIDFVEHRTGVYK